MITDEQLAEWERAYEALNPPWTPSEQVLALTDAIPVLIAEVRRLGTTRANALPAPADPVPPMYVTVEGMRGRVVDMEVHREPRLRRPTEMRLAVLFDEASQSWLDGLVIAGTPVALDIDCDGYPGQTTGVATSADGATVHFICKPIEWLSTMPIMDPTDTAE